MDSFREIVDYNRELGDLPEDSRMFNSTVESAGDNKIKIQESLS